MQELRELANAGQPGNGESRFCPVFAGRDVEILAAWSRVCEALAGSLKGCRDSEQGVERSRSMKKTQILITVEHTKEIPDLVDKVAGRAYTIDGVEDVTAKRLDLIELPVVVDMGVER